jgi:hypothetical protein
MTVNLSYFAGAGWQFFDDNGNPLSGGKLYSYLAGTTTPAVTYTSITGLTANPNPIILDAAGRPPAEVWATAGINYKFVVKTSTEVTIRTYDNLPSLVSSTDLANTTDPTLGDALVGFRQSNAAGNLTGAIGRTVHQKLQESISVLDFGATGDGVTNDSAAINAAALAATGKKLYIPAGTYKVKAVVINSDTTVECDVNTIFEPWDTTTKNSSNYCIRLNGDNITWRGGKVLGQIYTALGDNPSPYYCMSINKTTGDQHATNIRLEDFETEGGLQGVWAVSTEECTVQNVTIRSPYQWGLSFPAPRTKKLIVNNVRVYDSGINEGIKIASLYQETGDQTADVIINNADVQNCGALNPAVGQNGMDFFISSATRLHINNFNIVNCGAAGIEIKRNEAPNITPNTYQEILIQNGIITADKDDAGGITFNVTSPYPAVSAGTGKVIVSNVQFNYVGAAAPTSCNGISMNAWNDVLITGCQFNGDFTRYINPSSAAGTTDKTIANLVISNCVGYGGQFGVVAGDSLSNAKLIANVFETTNSVVVFNTSTTSDSVFIQGGYYKTSDSTAYGIQCSGTVNNFILENATVIGGVHSVAVNGSSIVRKNELTAATNDAIRINGGACVAYKNGITVLAARRAYVVITGSAVGYQNNRGSASSVPAYAAEVGELVYNNAPTSGGYIGWICTTAGSTSTSVWKTYGAIS